MQLDKVVCICSAYYYPHFGGVERYAESMAKYLLKAGCKVVVLTTSCSAKPGKEVKDGILIYRLPVIRILSARYPIITIFSHEYREIMKELREMDFSLFILNTRFYLTTLIGLMLARKGNQKAIVIEHGTGHIKLGMYLADKVGIWYEHFLTWCITSFFKPAFYGVSGACNLWLRHFGIKASGVISNGIDTEYVYAGNVNYKSEYSIPDDSVVFTFAGRLLEAKGILFILDLFKDFSTAYPKAYLFVAGTGPLYDEAEKYNSPHIMILGKLSHDEVMNLLTFTDVVVIPSDYPEGLPTLILEAGFWGCAVIATDRGGSKEVITDDQYGIIVPDINRDSFFAAMARMMTDRAYRESLQEKLHDRVVKEYSWEKISGDMVRTAFECNSHKEGDKS